MEKADFYGALYDVGAGPELCETDEQAEELLRLVTKEVWFSHVLGSRDDGFKDLCSKLGLNPDKVRCVWDYDLYCNINNPSRLVLHYADD